MAWIFFGFAAVFLLIASHPFVSYPLSLVGLRRIRRGTDSNSDAGSIPQPTTFSICLCAYNEATVIERTILNLLQLRKSMACTGDVQILLYIDGATDGTTQIAQRYAHQIDLLVSSDRCGKNYGINKLTEHVRGDIVVLMDANTEIAPDALINLAKYFSDPLVGCVCGHLVFVNADETVTAATGSLYWRLEERIKQLESDVGSAMGADGSLYAFRWQYIRTVPHGVADDMYLSLAILCDGQRVIRADDVRAYERSASSANDEFRRKIRIACQGFSAHKALWPRIRKLDALTIYQYFSHKFLRWFTAPLLLCAITFALIGIALTLGVPWAIAVAIGGVLLLWAGTIAGWRLFTAATDILQAFAATAIGVYQSLNGTLVGTWEPAGSVRVSSAEVHQ